MLKALHSTARKGAAIRANHVGRILTEGGDADEFIHVTLPHDVACKTDRTHRSNENRL